MQYSFILRSLVLDAKFLALEGPFFQKIDFVYRKYRLLIKNFLFGFFPGKSKEVIFGHDYYYDDVFGVAYLQSLYVDNAFLKQYILPKSIIIDIGANIGQFNFFCRHYLRAKEIYSIEPVKKTYSILRHNVGKNIFQFAISSHAKINFFIPPSLSLMASSYQQSPNDTREIVKGIKLDIFISSNNIKQIDLLKIDTEGSEYDVLVSGKKTVRQAKFILVESSMMRNSEGGVADICSLLKNICPTMVLVYIGRIFMERKKMVAVDLLFCQSAHLLT